MGTVYVTGTPETTEFFSTEEITVTFPLPSGKFCDSEKVGIKLRNLKAIEVCLDFVFFCWVKVCIFQFEDVFSIFYKRNLLESMAYAVKVYCEKNSGKCPEESNYIKYAGLRVKFVLRVFLLNLDLKTFYFPMRK